MLINDAVLEYLVQFHCTRDYFECHEILEEHWKSLENRDQDALWIGLIQVAVAQYHHRRGNLVGAQRMYRSAIGNIETVHNVKIGIDLKHLLHALARQLEQLNAPFEDINMLINDCAVQEQCEHRATCEGLTWGISSNNVAKTIKDKHKLRDRSAVIAQREQSLELKKQTRAKREQ